MAQAIEMSSIDAFVKESEVMNCGEERRSFQYNLNEKAVKDKLVKGAKINPFEVVENKLSSNLIFNLGAWERIVLPSILYWNLVKGNKSCQVGSINVTVASVKSGIETGGKHVDTQIIFYCNRDKVVCHFYNTTQLILVNGHGYSNLIDVFLKPYFESRIASSLSDIAFYNEHALEILGSKRVKRSSVKYTGWPTFLWCTKCDFAAKSQAALVKHKKTNHAVCFKESSSTSLVLLNHHSTRNNSVTEALLQENVTITDLSKNEEPSKSPEINALS